MVVLPCLSQEQRATAQHQTACRRRHISTLDEVTFGTHHLSTPLQALQIKKNVAELSVHTSAFLQRRPSMWRCAICYGAKSFGSRTSVLALCVPQFGRVLAFFRHRGPIVRLRASTHGTPAIYLLQNSLPRTSDLRPGEQQQSGTRTHTAQRHTIEQNTTQTSITDAANFAAP